MELKYLKMLIVVFLFGVVFLGIVTLESFIDVIEACK